MIAEATVEQERIVSLVQALLEHIAFELSDDGVPSLILNTQIDDIRCSVICMRVKNNYVRLSSREKQIAALIIKGLPNKTIAHTLDIKPSTVAAYVKRMFIKLNVNTRAEMTARIVQENLLYYPQIREIVR